MDDKKITELFFARSEQALSEIKIKYDKLCMKIAVGLVGRQEDAEECVASSYFKLWNAIPPKRPESLRGYLCKTVRNTALDYDRHGRDIRLSSLDELEDVIPASKTVEQEYDSELVTEYMNEFLGKSDKKNRGIFVMRYYFNQSVKDIANETGLSENAVSLRLSRMRAELKEYLKERGVDV